MVVTSESDSITFAGEVMQHHLSLLFLQSHYGNESRLSDSTSACGTRRHLEGFLCSRGACPIFFFVSRYLSINSLSFPVNGYSEGR